MPEYLAPGVFIEESENPKSIEGVSTSTAAMVGVTERGPENIPTLVTSFAEYRSTFGDYLNWKTVEFKNRWYLPSAVEGFFNNGGKRLFVVRSTPTDPDHFTFAKQKLWRATTRKSLLLGTFAYEDSGEYRTAIAMDGAVIPQNPSLRVSHRETVVHAQSLATPIAANTHSFFALDTQLTTTDPFVCPATGVPLQLSIQASKGADQLQVSASGITDVDASGNNVFCFVAITIDNTPVLFKVKKLDSSRNEITVTSPLPKDISQSTPITWYKSSATIPILGGATPTSNPATAHATLGNRAVLSKVVKASNTHLVFASDANFEKDLQVAEICKIKKATVSDIKQLPSEFTPLFVEPVSGLKFEDNSPSSNTDKGSFEFTGIEPASELYVVIKNKIRLFRNASNKLTLVDSQQGFDDSDSWASNETITAYKKLDLEILRLEDQQSVAFYSICKESKNCKFLAFVDGGDLGKDSFLTDPETVTPLVRYYSNEYISEGLDRIAPGAAVQAVEEVCELEALDRGLWGNRLRVSVQKPQQPVVRTTIVPTQQPKIVQLTSMMGVEAGTRLRSTLANQQNEEYVVVNAMADRVELDRIPTWNSGEIVESVEFNLAVRLIGHSENGKSPPVLQSELLSALSLDDRHSRYAPRILGAPRKDETKDELDQPLRRGDRRPLGESKLVRIRVSSVASANSKPSPIPDILEYEFKGRNHPIWFTFSGGKETEVSTADLKGIDDLEPTRRTGIQALRNEDDISLVAVPGIDDETVQGALIDHCQAMKYRFAVLDGPAPPNDSLNDIRDLRSRYDSRYASVYHPWLTIVNPLAQGSQRKELAAPPSGHVMGLIADVDVRRGVHKAPANEVLRGIIGLQRKIQTGEQELLNPFPSNINVIRDFRAENRGIRVWGARVISSDSEWKYVNVRRLFNFVEKSIERGMQWAVFEPNDEPLWARVRQSVTAFLKSVWKDGALQGRKADEAFFVRVDRTTMSQDDIDNGRLIVQIGIAPVKPAEFVIIRIGMFTSTAEA